MATARERQAATLAALLDTLPGPALLVDLKRRVRAANAAFRERLENVGPTKHAHCFELLHGRRRRCRSKGQRCPLEVCMGSATPVVAEHAHVRKGRAYPEQALLLPVLDAAGRVVACLARLQPGAARQPQATGERPFLPAAVHAQFPGLADGRDPVLLVGEPGTGKASVARAIHRLSPARGPFEERSGCELDAEALRDWLERAPADATLYLSDVHALGPAAQDALWAWLLRAARAPRLVVGTDRDLAERVATGALRGDLITRLAEVTLRVPPLRERADELPAIAELLLRDSEGLGRTLSPGAVGRLRQHAFAGNLDELAQAMRHASLMAAGTLVQEEDLPAWVGATRSGEGG